MPDEELTLVYQQRQQWFPDRAEGYLLRAVADAEVKDDTVRAGDILQAGINASASPASSLMYYQALLTD